jgi:hypothetical protein
MEKKEKPTLEYLKNKLEEKLNEPVNYFEIFTDTEIPPRWCLYGFNNSYLIEKDNTRLSFLSQNMMKLCYVLQTLQFSITTRTHTFTSHHAKMKAKVTF